MDDRIAIGTLVYILLVGIVFSVMPSSFVSRQPDVTLEKTTDLQVTVAGDFDSSSEQVGFLRKVLTLFFVPFTVAEMPLFIGLLIGLLNYISIFIGIVYLYDKIRGIGS